MSSAVTDQSEAPSAPVATRAANGQFLKGHPGHRRNHLVSLQRDLEIAVREHINPDRVKRIVNKLCEMAEGGNMKAIKLLLDKIVSNATNGDEAVDTSRQIVFKVVNATFAVESKQTAPPITGEVVDAEFTASNSIPSVPQDPVNGH